MLKQIILDKRCGTITPVVCSVSDNKNGEVAFIIKDEIGYIKRVNDCPEITFRNGLVNVNNVIAFVNIVNLNNDKDLMYESFIDYYNPIGKDIINSLCTQNRIIFQFRDKNLKKSRQFIVKNRLNKLAIKYREKCLQCKPWTVKDYEIGKYIIHREYEDVVDIWHKLSGNIPEAVNNFV